MEMKKKVLVSLLSLVVGMNAAHAVSNLEDTDTTVDFATEIDVNGTGGTELLNLGNILDGYTTLGMPVVNGTKFFIRIDLNGATFNATEPGLTTEDANGATPPVPDAVTNDTGVVKLGGQEGDAYVIFEVTAGADLETGDFAIFAPNGLVVKSESDVTGTFKIFETLTLASGGTSSLVSKNLNVLGFAAGSSVTSKSGTASKVGTVAKIDVTKGATEFEVHTTAGISNADTNTIGQFALSHVAGDQFNAVGDGATPSVKDDFDLAAYTNDTTLVVTGRFDAASKVFVSTGDCTAGGGTQADSFNSTTATFTFAAGAVAENNICMQVDGTTVIPEADFTGVFTPDNKSGYDTPVTALTFNGFENNGSEANVTLGLTPGDEGGAYPQFIRITNPTDTAGKVFVTLYNDAGTPSKQITLDQLTDKAGNAFPATLDAGASTPLVRIGDLYRAAQALDASFAMADAASKRNKLRIKVNGEFGTSNVNAHDQSGVIVRTLSTSKNGNTLTSVR